MNLSRTTALLMLLIVASASTFAQQGRPSDEQIAKWRAMREANGGESAGPRPPENATPEERRAFWQRRAAERAQAETSADAAPAATAPATPAATAPAAHDHSHGPVPAGKPAGAETDVSKPAPAPAKPEDAGRAAGRPGGMPMGMRGGGNVLWLSDSPPARGDGPPRSGMGGMRGMGGMGGGGMGGMAMAGERNGPPVKKLWLRAGADPQKSGFAREDTEAVVETLLVTPQGKPEGEPLPPAEDGKRNLSFEMPVQGYYRLYLITRKLQGDSLSVSVAKSEITNFSHGATEEERSVALAAPRILESAPIEIVREKNPEEKLFFQLKSGDEQAFVVLQKGLPVQGARVRFVSHNGWTKEAVSDEQGRVSFQVVRDYFPSWDEFQKRFKATWLVIAEASAAENGSFKDQPYGNVRYQATLSGAYYPSPDDYRSYAWGLGIGFAFLLFCGTAIYLYRRRRVKPFAEVRFDEKH
jgi:hypothetical protein